LHTTSRPQAWPSWAQQSGLDAKALKFGQGFEHLYYLLEAAVAGLGVAIAPEPLVAEDLKAGRLVAPWGFCETPAQLALWLPKRAADGRARQLAQWLKNELRQAD
jgi:DNA-binding transcriptional LysR family regulator